MLPVTAASGQQGLAEFWAQLRARAEQSAQTAGNTTTDSTADPASTAPGTVVAPAIATPQSRTRHSDAAASLLTALQNALPPPPAAPPAAMEVAAPDGQDTPGIPDADGATLDDAQDPTPAAGPPAHVPPDRPEAGRDVEPAPPAREDPDRGFRQRALAEAARAYAAQREDGPRSVAGSIFA